jgi:bifunctional DNA-binding transcriptional regulator/antitoxin component of YhaV-PrlF toxin-antitoxin module
MFVSRAVSVGGSLMVTIPKQIAEMLNIHPNESLELEVRKLKKSGFGLYAGIKSFTKDDELDIHD